MEKKFDQKIVRMMWEAQKKSGYFLGEFYPFDWRFTEKERSDLKNVFAGEDQKNVMEDFIVQVERLCHEEMILHDYKSRTAIECEAKLTLSILSRALSKIEMIYLGKIRLARRFTIPNYSNVDGLKVIEKGDGNVETFNAVVSGKAWAVISPMRELIKTIEARPKVKQGRRGPPGNISGFEKKIYKIFQEITGRKEIDGLFIGILEIVRKAVEKPNTDLSKTLKTL